MPSKTSEQNQMKFLFEDDSLSKLNKEAEDIKTEKVSEEQLKEQNKSKKLNSKADVTNLNHSVMSAVRGEEMETKSSSKFVGQTLHSIWGEKEIKENNNIKEDTIKEAIKAEEIAFKKKEADKERMSNVPISGKGAIDKGTLSKLFGEKDQGSYKYQVPKGNISIFDDGKVFDKLADKTGGEKLSEEKAKTKEQDQSWKNDGRMKTTKSLFDNLFE